jgi:hypothetical protein
MFSECTKIEKLIGDDICHFWSAIRTFDMKLRIYTQCKVGCSRRAHRSYRSYRFHASHERRQKSYWSESLTSEIESSSTSVESCRII